MARDENQADPAVRLRRIAEEQSRKRATLPKPGRYVAQDLVHELHVHQIELEIQNDELRQSQERLCKTMEKYNDLYDFAPVGYVTSDKDGFILEANLTFAGQLGVGRGQLVHSLLRLCAAVPDRTRFQMHLNQVFQTRKPCSCELRLANRSEAHLHVQLDSIWRQDENGVELCRTSVTDISARKAVEEELKKVHEALENRFHERTAKLQESEAKFRKLYQEFQTLLHTVSDTLILFSPELDVLWTNHAYELKSWESGRDAVSEYCSQLLSNLSSASDISLVTRSFATSEKQNTVVVHDGSVLDVRAFPIKEGVEVNSVLLWISDITEKMTLQAESLQAGHLAALGELAAGVAHEINNPITGIINYGQILINECPPESMEKDMGVRIVKEGERVSLIVKTLLSYARDRRKGKRPTQMQAVLEESLILSKAQIRKEGIQLKIAFSEENLPRVNANGQQMQQVFINIINNARDALNEKFPQRDENKFLEISMHPVTLNDQLYVRTEFFDSGIGISPEDLALITKPFFSTKAFGKGTGLGLSITQSIINDHEGWLAFESVKNEFTRVSIDLPAIEQR